MSCFSRENVWCYLHGMHICAQKHTSTSQNLFIYFCEWLLHELRLFLRGSPCSPRPCDATPPSGLFRWTWFSSPKSRLITGANRCCFFIFRVALGQAKCFYIANLPVTLSGFPRSWKILEISGKNCDFQARKSLSSLQVCIHKAASLSKL